MAVKNRQRDRYRVDISALHAHCEGNYARLMRLFPDYQQRNDYRFAIGDEQVHIEVTERSRYTTEFRLRSWLRRGARDVRGVKEGEPTAEQSSNDPGLRWLAPLVMELRAYHDATMLEVIAFQHQRRAEARYQYPNPAMLQQDEKLRQNVFLGDWLEHALRNGRVTWEPGVPPVS